MNTQTMTLFEHFAAFIVVNFVGILCIGAMYYFIRKPTSKRTEKFRVSVAIGFISILFWAAMISNVGILFWIKSGDLRASLLSVPLMVCGAPIVFPAMTAITYFQLVYADMIREHLHLNTPKHRPPE